MRVWTLNFVPFSLKSVGRLSDNISSNDSIYQKQSQRKMLHFTRQKRQNHHHMLIYLQSVGWQICVWRKLHVSIFVILLNVNQSTQKINTRWFWWRSFPLERRLFFGREIQMLMFDTDCFLLQTHFLQWRISLDIKHFHINNDFYFNVLRWTVLRFNENIVTILNAHSNIIPLFTSSNRAEISSWLPSLLLQLHHTNMQFWQK